MSVYNLLFLMFYMILLPESENIASITELREMKQLHFMEGTWEGSGWMIVNRDKKTFTQTETITPRVDSSILIIDGIGYSTEKVSEKPKVIHDAFGVISFNDEKQAMTMISFSTTGGKMENVIDLIGFQQLEWSFESENGAIIRFREDFSEEGIWLEKGDYSIDGVNWFPFFEMKLVKQ